jgi:hypothetical protein
VHGSERSLAALDWAARLAAGRGWELDVVTAWPESEEVFVHDIPGHHCVPRERATEQLEAALARLDELPDQVPEVVSWLVNAPVPAALLDLCGPDSVLVVGASHHDAQERSRPLGVDEQCTLHARGAVVVVDTR